MSQPANDTKPELKWLPITELYIPHKYQRTLEGQSSLRNIEKIQREFNWASFNTILVCKLKKENAKYAIIDGQHRFRAAELRDDIKEVPCVIISPREVKEQAQIFMSVNSQRLALTSLQMYKAGLVAGDKDAVKFDKICTAAGIVVPNWATLMSSTPANVFTATGYALQMLRSGTYREEHFIWAFKVIREAYPEEPGALRFSLVRALMEWVKQAPETKASELVDMLTLTEINQIETMVREFRVTTGGQNWKAYLTIIGKLYASFNRKKKVTLSK